MSSPCVCRWVFFISITLGILALVPRGAAAQSALQPQADVAATPSQPPETELNLIGLPTTRSLARHQSYFRLTHRFARDLRRGDFASLLEDLFSLDNGATIGLEYRFGVAERLQAGVHRTSLSRTIQFFGRYDAWRQDGVLPVSVSAIASVEGLDNFQDHYQPAVGATISRSVGRALMLYAAPVFVANTRAAEFLTDDLDHGVPGAGEEEHADHEHTFVVGAGARLRILPSACVVAEYSPRVAGHDPGRGVWGVGIEKHTRGHTLQLNVTNAFATTYGQLARGGSEHDVYLGFNLTRRF